MNQIPVIISRLSESFLINCRLFVLTLVFSLPLGLLIAFGSMCRFKPLRWLVRTFVWIIRGTPLMLQLIIIFYGPGLLGMSMTWPNGDAGRFTAATVAFVINYACYLSEIYRGGIESIPKGQYEAGQVLGMTKGQIFFKVTLLQVVKRILPPVGNEVITLVKDTSLARIIANKEIIMMAGEYSSKGLIWPLFATGVYFLIFIGVLTVLFDYLEKKLSYFHA
ncbi:MAG TPA: amino acid ABC transporter permease [Clostridiaceae bacterium]|jgi:polar amino acid transport system permease protein|nr:amino acid ABC transporter permease [Clostridiaceae bacterium]